jgi:DNA primase
MVRGGQSKAMPQLDTYDGLAAALLEIAKIRFHAFRERFGREPEPDEPLLFDPSEDEPIEASWSERMLQVLAAASVTDVDAAPVLQFLGFEYDQ